MKTKYRALIEDDLLFQPVVCETFGGWGESSIKLFRRVSEKLAERNFTEPRAEFKYLMNAISFRLQMYNARMLVSRMYMY